MYYRNEDYIRDFGCNPNTQCMRNANEQGMEQDLEGMYPDVYNVVYPMIMRACDNTGTSVTEEHLIAMTDDIYDRVEADGRINMNMDPEDEIEYRQFPGERIYRRPRRRNRFVRDLIRVLLLRELIGRRRR